MTSDSDPYPNARYIPDSTWHLFQPLIVINGTKQSVPELWSIPLLLSTVQNIQYLTSDPATYLYARYITDSIWPLIQPINVMHDTYQTIPDLWSRPLPLCTLHNRQYLTPDPPHYRYALYISDITWPLMQSLTVMKVSYQTKPNLWSKRLPLCKVYTRQYLTSDPSRLHFARYIPDITWRLIQSPTVMHGTYQAVPAICSSLIPLLTVLIRVYLNSDPARYCFAQYIAYSTIHLILPLTFMHGT